MQNKMTINGSGRTSGGSFEKVVIRGEGTITGDVECGEFKCRGTSTAHGTVKTEEISIAGQSAFKGNVTANHIKVYGQAEFQQDVDANKLTIWGDAEVGGNLRSDEVNVRGRIQVQGDIEAETFKARGGFKVQGLLNAENIEIAIRNFGPSEVGEMGGENISVKRRNGVLGLFNNHHAILSVGTIEGDDIYLEYTNAKLVRGTNVRIGTGCSIDVVEYKKDFHAGSDTSVKENRKI